MEQREGNQTLLWQETNEAQAYVKGGELYKDIGKRWEQQNDRRKFMLSDNNLESKWIEFTNQKTDKMGFKRSRYANRKLTSL